MNTLPTKRVRLWRDSGMWRLRCQHARHHSTFWTPRLRDALHYGWRSL